LVTVLLTYKADLQGRNMQVSYSSARRLAASSLPPSPRLLAAIAFSTSFDLSTYPPATYYPDSTLARFTLLQKYTTGLAVGLLALCLVLIPRKMHLHSATLGYVPAQIYILYTLIPSAYTDWVQYVLQTVARPALFGGYTMGECCQVLYSNAGVTTELTNSSGIALAAMFGSFLLLALLLLFHTHCLNISKQLRLVGYFIFTLNLLLFLPIAYNAMNAFRHYILLTPTDVFNTLLAVFIHLLYLLALIALWTRTYQLRPREVNNDNRVHSLDWMEESAMMQLPVHSAHRSEKISPEVSFMRKEEGEEGMESEDETKVRKIFQQPLQAQGNKGEKRRDSHPLLYDYVSLYRNFQPGTNQPIKAKYFLPILMTKLYLTAILASILQATPFAYLVVASCLELSFLLFVLIVHPFESTFTNLRIALLSLCFVGTSVVFCVYLKMADNNHYDILYEEIIIYLVLTLLALAFIFALAEHLLAWRREVWKVLEPCLKGTRLIGTRNVNVFQLDAENSNHMEHSFKMSSSSFRSTRRLEENEQMDAFYARMLKKENLNNKYKR
jgi:hypothetical protein